MGALRNIGSGISYRRSEVDCRLETLYTGALRNIESGISYCIAKMEWSALTPNTDPVRLAIANGDIASDLRQGQPPIAMNVCRPATTLQYDLTYHRIRLRSQAVKPCHMKAPIAIKLWTQRAYKPWFNTIFHPVHRCSGGSTVGHRQSHGFDI